MRIALAALVLVAGFLSSSADAAFVYFRGSVALDNPPADPLGLMTLPNQNFEALVETSGNAIIGSYIVFQGKDFSISGNTGTELLISGTNVVFGHNPANRMFLSAPNNGSGVPTGFGMRFNFNNALPGVAGTSQTELNKLIGFSGTINIYDNGNQSTYVGTITAVPEPTSMALVGLAAVGAGAYRRFRRKPAAK